MIRAAFAIWLLAVASAACARERLSRVPFVGCPADGQTGPVAAPKTGHAPAIPAAAAARLAYYADENGLGVLAPRGWHCIELYGSSGDFLILTPEQHEAEEFFKGDTVPILGPAIQRSVTFGGTSGRYEVAEVIARYFPSRGAFVRHVVESDRDDEIGVLSAQPLRTQAYKTDVVRRRTANYIRFTTPAGKNGEGTNSRLLPGKLAIEGIRKIVGPTEEPELVGAEVRLPPNQSDLIEVILADAAK
jgi:hypothetical protein